MRNGERDLKQCIKGTNEHNDNSQGVDILVADLNFLMAPCKSTPPFTSGAPFEMQTVYFGFSQTNIS